MVLSSPGRASGLIVATPAGPAEGVSRTAAGDPIPAVAFASRGVVLSAVAEGTGAGGGRRRSVPPAPTTKSAIEIETRTATETPFAAMIIPPTRAVLAEAAATAFSTI